MALQLIIGGSGSGKSYCLYRKLIEQSMANPGRRYLVLVPEQFTMQTQKDLVGMHPAGGIMNIDVLSFQRLAYHVFDEVGAGQRTVLEETGKSLVIRRLAQENRERLAVLGSKLERMGYVGEMKSVLSELAQYNVGKEQLEEAVRNIQENQLLQDKLHDILILQESFRKYKAEKYITSEEILEVLCQVASRSAMLSGSVVALDGFTGFTPIQYQVLATLMRCAGEMLVTVTMDAAGYPVTVLREEELFALSKQTIWELQRIARETGTAESEPLLLGSGGGEFPRFAENAPLAFLEQHLMRYDGACYGEEQEAIRLWRASDPRREVQRMAAEILRLIREEGFRYREIAVVTGDMEGYGHYVERQFADCKIPAFIDQKRDILSNPFVEFLRSALEMVEENFTYSSVFRYLRSGLTGILAEAVDRMDNYCTAMGIRGYKKYAEPWTRTYQGQRETELVELNRTREQLMEQVREFKEEYSGRNRTVRQRTEGLYRWCERLQIQQQLADYELFFRKKGELALAREYAQVYRIVLELFDKLVELMGEEVIPQKEYAQILDAGYEEARVGIIPPGTDQVVVGDIERTRLKDVRALFFLGVNEGIIPAVKDSAGILSGLDRESLKELKLHLAPDRKENACIQQLYLYMNMTKPSERLYVSCSGRNRKGEPLRPSFLFGMLRDLYPQTKAEPEPEGELLLEAISGRQGLVELGRRIGEGALAEQETLTLGHYYMEQKIWRERALALLAAAGEQRSALALDKAVARAMYGSELSGSVTRLERYAACAYAHFLSYGLRLRERQEYTFAALDLGNILHKALELYTGKLEAGPYSWFDVPQEEQARLMDGCVEQVAADYGNTILLSSARNAYMIRRMKQLGQKTVWALTEQVRHGKFVPRGFEVSFSAADHLEAVNYELGDGSRLKLSGRIDRTDIYEDEEKICVKVIDYKTGVQGFDPVEVYYGLSLQLVVYLNAAVEMEARTHSGKTVVPAAMLYYRLRDPILEADAALTEEAARESLLRELCTKGLVNSSPDIIHLLDERIGSSSAVIPAGITKSGNLSARSSAVSTEQIEALSEHVKGQIRTFGEEILEGEIGAVPYRKGRKTACDYCPYRSVCGFDARIPGHHYKNFPEMTAKEVWEKLTHRHEIADMEETERIWE